MTRIDQVVCLYFCKLKLANGKTGDRSSKKKFRRETSIRDEDLLLMKSRTELRKVEQSRADKTRGEVVWHISFSYSLSYHLRLAPVLLVVLPNKGSCHCHVCRQWRVPKKTIWGTPSETGMTVSYFTLSSAAQP